MKIDIWSDFVCPFCYIGKRHLEEAIQDRDDVEIEFHSYELDPTAPEKYDGKMVDYFAEAKGMSQEEAQGMVDRVTDMARNTGLDYHYEKIQHGNSFKAHRLFQYAKTEGKGNDFMEAGKEAYFIHGAWLNDNDTLLTIAEAAGLDEAASQEVLESNAYAEHVRADQEIAQEIQVPGVPFFVINEQYGLSGAQPVDTFRQVLADIDAKNA